MNVISIQTVNRYGKIVIIFHDLSRYKTVNFIDLLLYFFVSCESAHK